MDELGLALEHEEARPPVDVRDQDRTARIPQEVLELGARLRDGNAHPAVPRVHGDDAELRHPVPPERGQHALRVVMDELFDLWCELGCHRHLCAPWWTRQRARTRRYRRSRESWSVPVRTVGHLLENRRWPGSQ